MKATVTLTWHGGHTECYSTEDNLVGFEEKDIVYKLKFKDPTTNIIKFTYFPLTDLKSVEINYHR